MCIFWRVLLSFFIRNFVFSETLQCVDYSKTDKRVYEIVQNEKDLSFAYKLFASDATLKNLQNVTATVFAPVDECFSKYAAFMNNLDDPETKVIVKSAMDYHVVAPRIIGPNSIPSVEKRRNLTVFTRLHHQSIVISKTTNNSFYNNCSIMVNGYAHVILVIKAMNGWVYKIDKILIPRWNIGPNIEEFLNVTHGLIKNSYIYESFSDELQDIPIPFTLFLIHDDGWKYRNFDIQSCVLEALHDRNNSEALSAFKQIILPGLWNTSKLIQHRFVKTLGSNFLDIARVYINENITKLLIGGSEIIRGDIPVSNGLIHILSGIPKLPRVNATLFLWHCLHEFCNNCPENTEDILSYFDNGGLIPPFFGNRKPMEYEVPSIRPYWVCNNIDSWFPPGWEPKTWKGYIQKAKSSHKNAHKLAYNGAIAAAHKIQTLEEKLFIAAKKLEEIEMYSDWTHMEFPPLWDAKILLSFIAPLLPKDGIPTCTKEHVEKKYKFRINPIDLLSAKNFARFLPFM